MNAKQCKRLRHLAEDKTIGKPAVAYATKSRTDRTLRVVTASTRGEYRRLKWLHRQTQLRHPTPAATPHHFLSRPAAQYRREDLAGKYAPIREQALQAQRKRNEAAIKQASSQRRRGRLRKLLGI